MNFGLEKKFHGRTFNILPDLDGPLVLRGTGISHSEYMHIVMSLLLLLLETLVSRNEHISHCQEVRDYKVLS